MPIASAASARDHVTGEQLGDEPLDAGVDLVADPAHRLDVLPGRVVELPVLVALARVDRAGVAAAHRDHDVGGADDLVGERLRELLAQVDAELAHRLDDGRVDPLAGRAARRADVDAALRAELDEPGGHLAAARVVDADEQHFGFSGSSTPPYRWRSISAVLAMTSMRVNIQPVKTIATLATSCPPLLAGPLAVEDAERLARGLKVHRRPGAPAAAEPDPGAARRRGVRLPPDRAARPRPAHRQPSPQGAARRRPGRARAARELGLLPRRARPAAGAARPAHVTAAGASPASKTARSCSIASGTSRSRSARSSVARQEVGPAAALLALDQAGVEQHLEVMADGGLGEAERLTRAARRPSLDQAQQPQAAPGRRSL